MAATITIGNLVKAGTVSRDDVVALARTMFDGRREPLTNGVEIVIPKFDTLTTHAREIIITALLTAAAITPDLPEPSEEKA